MKEEGDLIRKVSVGKRENYQNPIPAMLTLNLAEMQGRDWTNPARGAGARQAVADTAQSALEFHGQLPAQLPKANRDECPDLCHPSLGMRLCDACRKKCLQFLLNWQESKKEQRNGKSSCPWPGAESWL